MIEAVWVLDLANGLTATEVAGAIEQILQVELLVVEDEQEVFAAMIALKQGHGAFADALIAELGNRAGCMHTLTFDRSVNSSYTTVLLAANARWTLQQSWSAWTATSI